MAIASKDDNVFRFIHLRGPRPRAEKPDGGKNGKVPGADEEHVPHKRDLPEPAAKVDSESARVAVETQRGASSADQRITSELQRAQLVNFAASSPSTRLRWVVAAKHELEMLTPGRDLTLPAADGTSPASGVLAITDDGLKRLSAVTVSLLDRFVNPIVGTPITTLIEKLDRLIASRHRGLGIGPAPLSPATPQVQSVGVAELLVVKQQITRYEPADIAHIENVLAGEGKERTHRKLDRIEEETEWSSEETVTQERELEATQRFEVNKETSTTTQKDQQKGFGLSLSGKYGPTVEFSSELNLQNTNSQTESTRNAVNYARDVIERSRDSIVTTVREQRRRRVLREVEEVNRHSLNNAGDTHISGVYQFVDKIYTSQVFNYGLREMFDFLIPEPASYLIHLNKMPRSDIQLPVPPVELSAFVADASEIDEFNYLELGARYGVDGLTAPPPYVVIRRQGVTHGQGEASEGGQPRSFAEADVEIPQGYEAVFADVAAVLTSDEVPTLVITIGTQILTLKKADFTEVDLGQGNFKAYQLTRLVLTPAEFSDHLAAEKISIHVFANETANYTVKVKIAFKNKDANLGWQVKTYDKIAEAYRNLQLQYQQAVEEIRSRREQESVGNDDFGSPPSRNLRLVAAELKKHCLAVLRGTHDHILSTPHSGGTAPDDPPFFDIAEAITDGAKIRFLETAFEWDQLQYVFYPYFWARIEQWADRFHIRNLDPAFEEFLRAGSARVVVPVRPGLEAAVAHFLVTGVVWNGEGEPTVEDPKYRPIVEEIKERAGAKKGEVKVGEPWETRIPTAAVKLRKDDALPEWIRTGTSDWTWSPKP